MYYWEKLFEIYIEKIKIKKYILIEIFIIIEIYYIKFVCY